MSFLYPRKIVIRRLRLDSDYGAREYSGNDPSNEETIASNLSASIQNKPTRGLPDAGVPADAYTRSSWNILVRSQDRTLIKSRDVIVDDVGDRYLVTAPWWDSLGWNCSATLLEA